MLYHGSRKLQSKIAKLFMEAKLLWAQHYTKKKIKKEIKLLIFSLKNTANIIIFNAI